MTFKLSVIQLENLATITGNKSALEIIIHSGKDVKVMEDEAWGRWKNSITKTQIKSLIKKGIINNDGTPNKYTSKVLDLVNLRHVNSWNGQMTFTV